MPKQSKTNHSEEKRGKARTSKAKKSNKQRGEEHAMMCAAPDEGRCINERKPFVTTSHGGLQMYIAINSFKGKTLYNDRR